MYVYETYTLSSHNEHKETKVPVESLLNLVGQLWLNLKENTNQASKFLYTTEQSVKGFT